MQKQSKEYLTPKETAEYLNISYTTLWHFKNERPDFPKPRQLTSRTILYVKSELDDYIKNQLGA
ncbi:MULTISPECIES: helix-turn-helix transcriptional regulator [unclassified Campylobacter]|uniref:helix-turn-helix transcriptional regulator n=1 Tax=unclassified Campylobacter TaxID=2593542 RepID=UPI003D332C0F